MKILFFFVIVNAFSWTSGFAPIRTIGTGSDPQQRFNPSFGPKLFSPPHTTSSTSLSASPVVWALGHMLSGMCGAPIVFTGTRPGGWYEKIDLPDWTPPNKLFGPVWTTLYTCMGVAAARVANRPNNKLALQLWATHFLLNLIWAPVFFGWKRLRLGCIINYILVASFGMIIPLFYQSNPTSAFLLVPYVAWVAFATKLNQSICSRNPTKGGYNEAMLQADLIRLQNDALKYANGA